MKKIKYFVIPFFIIGIFVIGSLAFKKEINFNAVTTSLSSMTIDKSQIKYIIEDDYNADDEPVYEEIVEEVVYDGLTLEELSDKLNRSLNSTISGKGELIASKSLELGVDPYLAVAIMLHETGCSWDCSKLVKSCNNVGGQKGSPSCNGGSYKSFATLDDGINGFLENLYKNYYARGLTTPEAMGPKYAGSSEWPSKVNSYISKIKAR